MGALLEIDDLALVERARSGDGSAFADLYERHVDSVRWVVADQVRDPEERAEAVQEAFTRAFRRIAGLRDPEGFRSWLFAIARNAAIDQRRARGRAPLLTLDQDDAPEVCDVGAGPEELSEAGEALAVVLACLERLSERDRAALGLVAHLGLAPAELGHVLGVRPGTAKVLVHRARARLRDLVVDALVERGSHCDVLPRLRAVGSAAAREHVRRCPDCNDLLHEVLAPVLRAVLI